LFGKIPQKDVREVSRLTPTAVERRALEPFLLSGNDWRYLRRDHPQVYRTPVKTVLTKGGAMPKARKKKNSSFQTTITKSVFLYGRPNKEKLVILQQMQNSYTALINRDIDLLEKNPDIVLQLVKNDKKFLLYGRSIYSGSLR
jgi:hypothetical protein